MILDDYEEVHYDLERQYMVGATGIGISHSVQLQISIQRQTCVISCVETGESRHVTLRLVRNREPSQTAAYQTPRRIHDLSANPQNGLDKCAHCNRAQSPTRRVCGVHRLMELDVHVTVGPG